MDSMEQDLAAYLIQHPKITARISTVVEGKRTVRLYSDVAPQKVEYPFAVTAWVGEDGSHHMRAAGSCIRQRLQIDIYAKDTDGRAAAGKAFRYALDGMVQKTLGDTSFSNIRLQNVLDGSEPPGNGTEDPDFRRTMLFDVWYHRDVPQFP